MLYIRAMSEHKTIFGIEEKAIERAETVLKDPQFQANPLREEFQTLLKHFKRMLQQFRRLIKLSDSQQLQLKQAYEKIEEQNAELIEAGQLREDVDKIMHHDLKSPLSTIIAVPALIRFNENLTPIDQDYLNRIEEAGLNMLTMINHSLDLFKMERGFYQFSPIPINILHILRKITAETRVLQEAKQVTLEIIADGKEKFQKEHSFVRGEELLCYSMLSNLIKNALEASPEHEQITITLKSGEATTQIIIHNHGAVAEAIRARFFEKYVTFGKHMGTGLGTYTAKLFAEIQEGSISMSTSEAEGTTVTVQLPKIDIAEYPNILDNVSSFAENGDGKKQAQRQRYPFDWELLENIPDDLLKSMSHAVLMLDIPAMYRIIEQIRIHNDPLADSFTKFVNEYRFDVLHNVLNP